MSNRTVARWLAKMRGYFWLPCPVCGEDFAGFETYVGECCVVTTEGARTVCSKPDCVTEGKRQYDLYVRPLLAELTKSSV